MTIATDQRPPAVTPGPPPLGLPRPVPVARDPSGDDGRAATTSKLAMREVDLYYGERRVVRGVTLDIRPNSITALIGPSGCGKSTVLRSFNRMNDLIPAARTEGEIIFRGKNLYAADVDPVEVRRRIGMVFQKANPFPKSIYENIAYGPRINGWRGSKAEMDELVERSLRGAALWDDVKDKLQQSGLSLSGGQQQRLCIARALATQPEVILMDEPCSALDPISTLKIEELMFELRQRYTIIIVTHNMQQASRASDYTAFFLMNGERAGELVEYAPTKQLFQSPSDPRTEQYISGRFG